uniref:Uncharacterized protein n=1 Tax=Knipowitschia caucasica TaxID=637954 RepID=A0AAV2JA53_KNICA
MAPTASQLLSFNLRTPPTLDMISTIKQLCLLQHQPFNHRTSRRKYILQSSTETGIRSEITAFPLSLCSQQQHCHVPFQHETQHLPPGPHSNPSPGSLPLTSDLSDPTHHKRHKLLSHHRYCPSQSQNATIKPLHRKPNLDPFNFRPISNLSLRTTFQESSIIAHVQQYLPQGLKEVKLGDRTVETSAFGLRDSTRPRADPRSVRNPQRLFCSDGHEFIF